jgi:hypothetical protein
MERAAELKRWHRIVLGLLVAVLLGSATLVGAAEGPTRVEYVGRLESVCKPDAEATQRAMQGARTDIKAERLAVAAGKFGKAARIFGSTVNEIAQVPRPPADTTRLARWFEYLRKQEAYLRDITAELKADHAIKAQRLIARFIHSGNLANNVVLAFGFNYCSFKFSRYG